MVAVEVTHTPREDDRTIQSESLDHGFFRVVIPRGFMDVPDVPRALGLAVDRFALPLDLAQTTYYVGRETYLATAEGKMGKVSEQLFAFLARNADSAPVHFCLPPAQVVEIGLQIDL